MIDVAVAAFFQQAAGGEPDSVDAHSAPAKMLELTCHVVHVVHVNRRQLIAVRLANLRRKHGDAAYSR